MSEHPSGPGMDVVEGQLDTAEIEQEKERGEVGQDGSSSDGDSGPDGSDTADPS